MERASEPGAVLRSRETTGEHGPASTVWGVLGLVGAVAAAVGSAVLSADSGHLSTGMVRSVLVVAWAAAGAASIIRRPSERQGRLLMAGALVGAAATGLAALVSANHRGVTLTATVLSAVQFLLPVAVALLPISAMHVLLGLPDGTCRLSRTAIGVGYAVGAVLGVALWTEHPSLPLWPVGVEAAVAVPIGLAGSHRRYRRARGAERQRMQWFGWSVAVGGEVVLVALALRLLSGWPTAAGVVVAAATLPIPVGLTLAISPLAGRIGRLLAHTVSLAGLSGVVLSIYLVIVVGLGRTPTGRERPLLALSVVAAGVAAMLYGRARERLSQFANRVVYGEVEAPDAVLRTFASRLSRAIPMDELLLQVAESLRKTLGLSAAELWTGSGGRLERSVSVPDSPAIQLTLSREEESVVARAGVSGPAWVQIWLPALLRDRGDALLRVAPTTHAGHVLGLIVAVRPAGADPFSTDDDTMMTELARQIGLALHNVELDSALQASLDEVRNKAEELEASRARIVASADAARRKIERDLHDGAQQHLVALAVNLRLARQLAATDAAASMELLDQLGTDLQDAVQQLRALAHGIYPPLLVDRGVGEALRSATGRAALPTTVDADGLGRHSPEIEAAVYFCCMEALQNAGKHAGPGARARVRVWEEAGGVLFEVADDGAGFDAAGDRRRGAGFVNMSDRVGAIGGVVVVRSEPGQGTSVSGRIPVIG